MRSIKKILKWIGLTILTLLIVGNLAILFSGRYYIYKAIASTYFRGHTKPHITDLDIFENRSVDAATAQPWVEHEALGKFTINPDHRNLVESLDPASFLVMWGDTVVYEEYWEGYDQATITNSFSMAKSIVSILIGIAHDEGLIKSLDDPVANYLPEWKDDDKNKITIRHILTMTSGLSWSESYVHPFCDVAELYYDTDDRDLALNRREIEEEPGKTWGYKSGDTQVLVYILEAVTGMKMADYASEKLWKPMGAESEAMWSLSSDENSSEKGFCCFYSTTRDFARFGKLINHLGNWNGQQLVSAQFIKEMKSIWPVKKGNGNDNNLYGYQYWIMKGRPYEVTYFRGMSGQYIISVPAHDLVIVRTGNGVKGRFEDGSGDLEGHYLELPDYVDIGMDILNQVKTHQHP